MKSTVPQHQLDGAASVAADAPVTCENKRDVGGLITVTVHELHQDLKVRCPSSTMIGVYSKNIISLATITIEASIVCSHLSPNLRKLP